MSKVVKVSDRAYQRIAEEASLQGIFLIDALDNLLFNQDSLVAIEEEDGDSTLRVVSDLVDVDKFDVYQQQAGQLMPRAPESDPCPMCGAEVGWSGLSVRRSPMAFMLKHGNYRRCPECHIERQVAI